MMVIELGRAAPLGDWFASLGETSGYRGGFRWPTEQDLSSDVRRLDRCRSDSRARDLRGRLGLDGRRLPAARRFE